MNQIWYIVTTKVNGEYFAEILFLVAEGRFLLRYLFSPFLWLVITQPIDGHIVLLDEHGDVELRGVDDLLQFLHLVDVVELVLDGRGHEGGEPPAGQPGPHGRMDGVEILIENIHQIILGFRR